MPHTKKTVETIIFVLAFFLGGYLGSLSEGHRHGISRLAQARVNQANGDIKNTHADHGKFDVAGTDTAPSIKLALHQDPHAGWNLHVITEHFRFSPEQAGQQHVLGQGHGHLYIDGRKVSRVYGPWVHIPKLEPGAHEIKVTLATNSHQDYALGGRVIAEILNIAVTQAKADD